MRPSALAVTLLFPVVIVASAVAIILSLAGSSPPVAVVALAGLVLVLGALGAAALAAVALARREWGWAAAILVLWPFVLTAYLRRLLRAIRSGEAEG